MARTLVIDTIRGAGRTFKVNKELQIAPTLKKFLVHFRRPIGYRGEYGFDWLRDEYIYPIETVANDHDGNPRNAPLELCDDVPALKTEYKTTDVLNSISPYGYDYYPAWLTMFPNTSEAQGTHVDQIQANGIDLDLKIEELEVLSSDTTEIVFESSNNNLIITPTKIPLSELLTEKGQDNLGRGNTRDYYLANNKVNIKCEGNLPQHEQIKVFAQLNDQREEVGKLMVCKNSDYKNYTIDIYLIKSFLNDDPSFGGSMVDTELAKLGGVQGIENYLNKRSLNQSLIKVNLIYDSSRDWVFRKQSLINASNGGKYNGMIQNQSTMLMDTKKYMDYINDRFRLQYPNLVSRKAIFLYITPFLSPTSGGASYNSPLNSKHIILFKKNIDHLPSYAHEIGHTLGLEHSFKNDPALSKADLIAQQEAKRTEYRRKIAEQRVAKTQHLNEYSAYYNSHPEEKREAIRKLDANIKVYEDALSNVEDKIEVINKNPFQFIAKKTENIMDYDLANQKVFFKWQSKVMREETKQYYH
ncbi:hypothetical protein [Sinomicrobium sp. M5D2P9]